MGIADSVPYTVIRGEGKQRGGLKENGRSAKFCYVIHGREWHILMKMLSVLQRTVENKG